MPQTFGRLYADAYDTLYQDKDYAGECDLIEHIFLSHGNQAITSVLDLGCGSGGHAVCLAKRGYKVTGVDRSEEMLGHARRKLSGDKRLSLVHGDIRNLDLDRRFDAAIMMFAVLGYQLENSDVLATLKAARNHLRPEGLLVFDVWYGPAVLIQRPSQRVKIVQTSTGRFLRTTDAELDIHNHRTKVQFNVWELDGDRLVTENRETHLMRFFFSKELELFLDIAGFEPVAVRSFPDFDNEPDETTWNVVVVARVA
jgi:SAM-dependent methyltransferase